MKKIFLNNYRLKVTALLLAMGLWFFVYFDQHPRFFDNYTIRIVYQNQNKSLTLDGAPQTVQIRVKKGNPTEIAGVDPQKMWADADLAGLDAGPHAVPLKVHEIPGVKVVNNDISVNVNLKRLNKLQRTLDVILYVPLPVGKGNGVPKPESDIITFFGPENSLNRIERAAVSIYLTSQNQESKVSLPVIPIDKNGVVVPGVQADPAVVTVTVPVARTKPVKLAYRGNLYESSKKVIPEVVPSTVTVFGQEKALDEIEYVNTDIFDAERCRRGERFVMNLDPPKSLFTSPSSVVITCRVPEIVPRGFTASVAFLNLAPGLKAQLDPDKIEVTIQGEKTIVNQLTLDRISATVDLRGRTPGQYKIDPVISLQNANASGINIQYDKSPIRVTITRASK